MTRYQIDFYDDEADEIAQGFLDAETDEAAITAAKARYGDRLNEISRADDGAMLVVYEHNPTVYIKYILDECETLDQVIAVLRAQADEFERLQTEGAVLESVDGGYVHMRRS